MTILTIFCITINIFLILFCGIVGKDIKTNSEKIGMYFIQIIYLINTILLFSLLKFI